MVSGASASFSSVVRFQHGVHFVSHTAPMRKESGLAIGDPITVRLTVVG